MPKSIFVHMGPHKTGSTAIQKTLLMLSATLKEHDAFFLHNKEIHEASLLLSSERFDEAEAKLTNIGRQISNLNESRILLSQEDFSGELIGRTRRRAIYPRLTKNMRIIMRSLKPHRVKFIFFIREEESWLKSCYHQHLKHQTLFSSFQSFKEHYDLNFSWKEKLERSRETFGDDLIVSHYVVEQNSGIRKLLSLALPRLPSDDLKVSTIRENTSPTKEQISKLEHVNKVSEFKETAWFAKSLIVTGWEPKEINMNETSFNPWPYQKSKIENGPLNRLQKRVSSRVSKQDIIDLLPEGNVDLRVLISKKLPEEAILPELPRSDMQNQIQILKYHLRGQTELSFLNALVISYLRRDTPFTEKARKIFHRIWEEQGVILINELSTRWLISTLQTYFDHGKNENQRLIGASSYFYANLVKIYEGERAIEGRDQDGTYSSMKPQTPNRFRGMDRYELGGTDLLLNTNALALEIANKEEVSGLVFKELLLRVKQSGNVFTRNDKSRKKMNINIKGFEDTWSFFEP